MEKETITTKVEEQMEELDLGDSVEVHDENKERCLFGKAGSSKVKVEPALLKDALMLENERLRQQLNSLQEKYQYVADEYDTLAFARNEFFRQVREMAANFGFTVIPTSEYSKMQFLVSRIEAERLSATPPNTPNSFSTSGITYAN